MVIFQLLTIVGFVMLALLVIEVYYCPGEKINGVQKYTTVETIAFITIVVGISFILFITAANTVPVRLEEFVQFVKVQREFTILLLVNLFLAMFLLARYTGKNLGTDGKQFNVVKYTVVLTSAAFVFSIILISFLSY